MSLAMVFPAAFAAGFRRGCHHCRDGEIHQPGADAVVAADTGAVTETDTGNCCCDGSDL